jgi:hypothetical protein
LGIVDASLAELVHPRRDELFAQAASAAKFGHSFSSDCVEDFSSISQQGR